MSNTWRAEQDAKLILEVCWTQTSDHTSSFGLGERSREREINAACSLLMSERSVRLKWPRMTAQKGRFGTARSPSRTLGKAIKSVAQMRRTKKAFGKRVRASGCLVICSIGFGVFAPNSRRLLGRTTCYSGVNIPFAV